MDPKVALDLSKNRKVKVLLKFLLQEMDKFNSVDDIEVKDLELLGVEIKARKLAFKKLEEVLKPILDASGLKITFNKNEYIT